MSGEGAPIIRLLLADGRRTLVTKQRLLTDRAVEAVRNGSAHVAERFVLWHRSNAALQSVERS
jgi:hypothetical protein